MIGEFFGNYRATAKLGEGGMGAVYLAVHPEIGRKVAVKLIRPAYASDAQAVRRFVREARGAAMVRHPALVDIMDYGVHEKTGSAYIIMEYLEGESLEDRIAKLGHLGARKGAEVAREIALGMAAVHAAGIIHRDLKPGNVHLVADPLHPGTERVKVLDFGIAKLANQDTASGLTTRTDVVLGTPRYMAPEQCRGGAPIDHRADIYSLGCLLYEALAGRPPFIHAFPGELLVSHLMEVPAPPRAWVPTIPEPLNAIVVRLLAKNPAERPPTMTAVASALEQFLATHVDVPITTSTPPVAITSPPVKTEPMPEGGPPRGHATTTASVVMHPASPVFGSAPPPAVFGRSPSDVPVVGRDASGRTPRASSQRRTFIAVAAATTVVVVIAIGAVRRNRNDAAASTESSTTANPKATPPRVSTAPAQSEQGLTIPTTTASPASAPPNDNFLPSSAPTAEVSSARDEANTALPNEPRDTAASSALHDAALAPAAKPSIERSGARAPVRITIANAPAGLRVTVDGKNAPLPLRVPRDQKAHTVSFAAPTFRAETKIIVFDRDQTLTLDNRPGLYVP